MLTTQVKFFVKVLYLVEHKKLLLLCFRAQNRQTCTTPAEKGHLIIKASSLHNYWKKYHVSLVLKYLQGTFFLTYTFVESLFVQVSFRHEHCWAYSCEKKVRNVIIILWHIVLPHNLAIFPWQYTLQKKYK